MWWKEILLMRWGARAGIVMFGACFAINIFPACLSNDCIIYAERFINTPLYLYKLVFNVLEIDKTVKQFLRLFLRLLKLVERLLLMRANLISAPPWSSFSPGGYKLVICFLYEKSSGWIVLTVSILCFLNFNFFSN